MATVVAPYLRNEARDEDPSVVLTRPVTMLLGVSDNAAAALESLDIETVFDLAASTLFARALQLYEAAEQPESPLARIGFPPHDLVNDGSRPISELGFAAVSTLRGVGETTAALLRTALNVTTIRELALWPPYRAAREILNVALGGTADVRQDEERPLDLLPGTGRYPTERIQYEVLLLDRLVRGQGTGGLLGGRPLLETADNRIEDAGPIDITSSELEESGFHTVAVGALLTFRQSWYTLGLSLGQLLHALALAPGESTRIAVIDWSRRTRAATSEAIAETEALQSTLVQNRSIAEVTSAVAHEVQTGESTAETAGFAATYGAGSGAAAAGQYEGINLAAVLGTSFGMSGGASSARSWASSSGSRDISASMSQQITDATHQASSLTRNRRATAIREVSQQERENLSTRAVTNYNHMHALTIQYYEVVQLYRTVVELARVTRCIFIPMKLIDFDRPGVIARYRRVIASAGLDARVRLLSVTEPNSFVVSAPNRTGPWDSSTFTTGRAVFGADPGTPNSTYLSYSLEQRAPAFAGFYVSPDSPFDRAIFESRDGSIREVVLGAVQEGSLGFRVVPGNVWPNLGSAAAQAQALLDLRRISLRKSPDSPAVSGQFAVFLGIDLVGGDFADPNADTWGAAIRATINVPEGDEPVVAFEFDRTLGSPELLSHLRDNRLHYSQAVWRSLDAATLAVTLSSYTFGGQPLLEVIDPVPVAVAGNYLVFRTYAEDAQWEAFLEEKGLRLGRLSESVVPLPSGGVFAEAVLGRANAAEKLDLTRFWNWQDSPIPIAAPEIAALQAGSRGQPEDLEPGQLSQPVLNIVNPPPLPDPQGLAAILAAIQNGNMFRDMSGLAATIGLAQATMERGFEGAREAAAQAGRNAQTAANLLGSLYGRGAGGGAGAGGGGMSASGRPSSSPSEAGARLNYGRDMDRRSVDRGRDRPEAALGGDGGANLGDGMISSLGRSHETAAWESEVGPDQRFRPAMWGGSEAGDRAAGESEPFSVDYELEWSRNNPFGFIELGRMNRTEDPNLIVLWNFPVGSADISRFEAELPARVPTMQRWIDLGDEILIGGFASSSGTEELNFSLARARALNIKRWLVQEAGFPTESLQAISLGESQQLPPGGFQGGLFSGERAARQRRVEILRQVREWDEDAYDRAIAVVDGSTMPTNQKTRLRGVLEHLKDPGSDDLVFNRTWVRALQGMWGEPGYEWLSTPSMWPGREPPLVQHLRDTVAASLHPGLPDDQLIAELRSMDLRILEGIEWIQDQTTPVDFAEAVPHQLILRVNDWIRARQQDEDSIYYYYGAGQEQ